MAKPWNTLIIDDEAPARDRLKRLLEPYPQVRVTGEASNGAEAVEMIASQRPDLLFLDIEMPVLNGFEVLRQLERSPKVIFTTAYDQYALKAFEEESIDYLLKPVSAERLDKAINKLRQLEPQGHFPLPLDLLAEQLGVRKALKTITVKLGDRIILVKLGDIAFIEAEDKYVVLCTLDGRRHLTDLTLTALESRLPESFLRISRSVIVNMDQVAELRKSFNGTLSFLMNDAMQSKHSSGRSYSQALKDRLDL